MDLSKLKMPSAIQVDGLFFDIHTGHPYWFNFAKTLKDKDMTYLSFDYLYVNKKPDDRVKGFYALLNFFREDKLLPRPDPAEVTKDIALDYELDADLIYTAILEQYGVDIFEKEYHWHKIRAMINGLHNTKLNEIISYRLYQAPSKNETNEQLMSKLKAQWHIPDERDKAAEKSRDYFNSLLDKSKK